MNTEISIKLYSDLGTIETYNLIEEAFGRFDYVVKKYSRFDKDSELSKLNRNSGKEYKVDREFFDLIETALEVSKLSDYKFDPTLIDILEKYGYDSKKDIKEISPDELKSLIKTRPHPKQIILDKENLTVFLEKNQRLDFGSIGKGYAIDLAANVLKKAENFILNAGGDVFAYGKNEKNENWSIGLTTNGKNTLFGTIILDNAAVASSGNWAIKYKNFAHILDPRSGTPFDEIDQSFVVNSTAKEADVYATMLFLTGEQGLFVLEKEKIGGLIIKNGEAISNSFFPRY